MDTKTMALTLLVAVIMGSSGAVVYTLNTSTVDTEDEKTETEDAYKVCLLYTSPSPRDPE